MEPREGSNQMPSCPVSGKQSSPLNEVKVGGGRRCTRGLVLHKCPKCPRSGHHWLSSRCARLIEPETYCPKRLRKNRARWSQVRNLVARLLRSASPPRCRLESDLSPVRQRRALLRRNATEDREPSSGPPDYGQRGLSRRRREAVAPAQSNHRANAGKVVVSEQSAFRRKSSKAVMSGFAKAGIFAEWRGGVESSRKVE